MSNDSIANETIHDQIVLDRIGRCDVARYAAYANRPATRSPKSSHEIRAWALVGLLLMIGGFALLAYQGIRYTMELQSGGAVSSATPRTINIPVSPLVGITAMFAGYVLIIREKD